MCLRVCVSLCSVCFCEIVCDCMFVDCAFVSVLMCVFGVCVCSILIYCSRSLAGIAQSNKSNRPKSVAAEPRVVARDGTNACAL